MHPPVPVHVFVYILHTYVQGRKQTFEVMTALHPLMSSQQDYLTLGPVIFFYSNSGCQSVEAVIR